MYVSHKFIYHPSPSPKVLYALFPAMVNGDRIYDVSLQLRSIQDYFFGEDCQWHRKIPNRMYKLQNFRQRVIRRLYTISYLSTEKPTSCENLTGFSSSTEVISVI